MSTAIVSVYTSEGFVIGADGCETKGPNDAFVSDSLRKIFHVAGEGKEIAYAICGIHHVTSDDDSEVVWDLHTQVQRVARELAANRSPNLIEYATRISEPINDALLVARQSGKIKEYPALPDLIDRQGSTIGEILIDGYYFGLPSRARIRFFHDKQELCTPDVSPRPIQALEVTGSKLIWDAFS